MSNGSQFYVDRALELVVDPLGPPVVQNQLLDELKKCDNLVQLDWRYAQMVAGASKMQMSMIWVARNQDEPVSDTDLAALKDLAWSEIIKKRYLASVPGSSTVSDTTTSMLEIVREMNLQRRRFQIMGLHEQVEASEIHLVLHLCQAGLLRTDRYRTMANRFRRHDKLFEAFGLAVGAFVCASAPFTLGAATPRYERDLQYEYKKNATALFWYCLQQNMGGMNAVELEEDYVARIARLIVVWPDGAGKRRIGFKRGGKKGDDDDDDDDKGGDLKSMVLNSVVEAQDCAEKAKTEVGKLRGEFNTSIAVWGERREQERMELNGKIAEAEESIRATVLQTHGNLERELRLNHDLRNVQLSSMVTDVKAEIRVLENRVSAGGGGVGNAMAVDTGKLEALESKIDRIGAMTDNLAGGVYGIVEPQLRKSVGDWVDAKLAGINVRLEGLNGSTAGVATSLTQLTAQLNDYRQTLDPKVLAMEAEIRANRTHADAGLARIRQEAIDAAQGQWTLENAKRQKELDATKETISELSEKQVFMDALLVEIEKKRTDTDKLVQDTAQASAAFTDQLKEGLDKMKKDVVFVVAQQITDSGARLGERIDEFQTELTSFEEIQSELFNTIDAMNEELLAGKPTDEILSLHGDTVPPRRYETRECRDQTGPSQ
jgi:hypothetical protein